MDKQHILDEIRRTAINGKPLGRARFFAKTGIKEHDWLGRYWKSWGDAVAEAGFEPLSFNEKFDDEKVFKSVIELTRKLGKFPTTPEMQLERSKNPDFPNNRVIGRRWNRGELVEALAKFCGTSELYADVASILRSTPYKIPEPRTKTEKQSSTLANEQGYVYAIRAQEAYKIGCTRAPYRRAAEIANQSARGAELIHLISTDDPEGIEKYWHGRFSAKRVNGVNKQGGEWFALTAEDVRAFKKRKFM